MKTPSVPHTPSDGARRAPKLFMAHLRKLEDEDVATGRKSVHPCGKALVELFSRSLYEILTPKGKAMFEARVCKSQYFRSPSRLIEPILASKGPVPFHECLEDLCPAVSAAGAIRVLFRELPPTYETLVAAGEDMAAGHHAVKVEPLHRRLAFDAQKLLWNTFLGNRGFLEDRSSSAWQALGGSERAFAVHVWICVLHLLFEDSRSQCRRYFHSESIFLNYYSPEKFRIQWLRFKAADQEHRGVLTYRLNINVLKMLMQQGLSLDAAILTCLQEFSRTLQEMPRQVETFAHFYYGEAYASLIEKLKDEDAESASVVAELNRSAMPPRLVLAAGMFTGGFLLHQLNYVPGACRITLCKERYAEELRSLEHCSVTNLRVLAAVRSQARQHHKRNRQGLVLRIVEELGRTEAQAELDVAALLWYVREGAPILMHRPFRSLLPMMLTLDRYQSGYEASSFDPSRSVPRDEWEQKLSAGLYKPNIETMEEKMERIKYGALNIVQDVLGINGGTFYGGSYITLKNVRKMATCSYTDTASDIVKGVTGPDDVCSMFSGSECDLGTLDYAAGVIHAGWSKDFLQVAIGIAHAHVSSTPGATKTRRELMKEFSGFMRLPGMDKDCHRQYDEVQIHGQVFFREHVASINLGKPFKPDNKYGKCIRVDGKLVIVNPTSEYADTYDMSPSARRDAAVAMAPTEGEYESDDYYLFYEHLALLDDFMGCTPAFDRQSRTWSEEKKAQFRAYVVGQQTQLCALGALVLMDLSGFGLRYCFHLKRCLDCVRERYPKIQIRRIITNPETFEFEFEDGDATL